MWQYIDLPSTLPYKPDHDIVQQALLSVVTRTAVKSFVVYNLSAKMTDGLFKSCPDKYSVTVIHQLRNIRRYLFCNVFNITDSSTIICRHEEAFTFDVIVEGRDTDKAAITVHQFSIHYCRVRGNCAYNSLLIIRLQLLAYVLTSQGFGCSRDTVDKVV